MKRVGRVNIFEEKDKQGMIFPSEAELAAAGEAFAAFDEAGESLPPRSGPPGMGWGASYFIDDLVGTEFEGWTRDPSGQWYDRDGRPAAHDRDALPGTAHE